jgi:predicted amino acid racemase
MYPKVKISLKKFKNNVKILKDLCHKNGVSMMGVTKVFAADHQLVKILINEKVDFLADSRIINIKKYPNTEIPKVLLRIPSIYEVEDVIKYCDISLNSELETIQVLNKYAQKVNKVHSVILMIDLGDLREGIFTEKELFNTIEQILKMNNIILKGIGTNLTCYGGVIPTEENLLKLVEYKEEIEKVFDIKLDIISGGNSSSIELLRNGTLPPKINNLRLGETLVLGRETAYGDFLDGTYDDVFILESDIIEVKEKPSVPIGQIGMDAFGKIPKFKDVGNHKRAILAIGKQDVDFNELIPFDTIETIGSSSDHIILDVSNGHFDYRVGGVVSFRLTYSSILSLMTSNYVEKSYED